MRQWRWMCGLMLMAGAAWAADVTGNWKGSMDLDGGSHDGAYLHLKQTGAVITGSQGPSGESQFPITSGHIEGDQVTLEARPGASTLRLTMKLAGSKLTGEVFEDDQKIGTVALEKLDQ